MKDEQFIQRFLALHYVFPVPLNKIKLLLEYDPELTQLETMKPSLLASIGKISQNRAIKLREMYLKYVEIPLLQIYEKHSISPIIYTNPNYPSNLLNLYDPPAVLYIKGDINLLLMIRNLQLSVQERHPNTLKVVLKKFYLR
ncbi:hypothetical protein [Psychrobacillus sp. NEAU-3TGS]|uniref:hypothetical protein n=1 Tax=Psychrobacillus sp. NEAU-3TGS TaxID=2995412 RepID=UPI0032B38BEF